MVTKELSEAAVEVNCILEHSSQNILKKIPQNFINFIKEISSKTYKFNYDVNKSLNEQNVKPETRGLIALIYQDYICDKNQKNEYLVKCKKIEDLKEKELREKYNPDNLFKKLKDETQIVENTITEETAIVEYKEKNFLQKIFDKIKYLFKKN